MNDELTIKFFFFNLKTKSPPKSRSAHREKIYNWETKEDMKKL